MRPGDVLSRVFDKPLGIMSTSSYRAEAGTIQGRLDIAKYITMPKGELAGRVLLVDDLADSGVTLKAVVERLRGMPSISELRSAVIWTEERFELHPGLLRRDAGNQPVDSSAVRRLRRAAPRCAGEEIRDLMNEGGQLSALFAAPLAVITGEDSVTQARPRLDLRSKHSVLP